jgi:ABC-type nitrate/sulfonate/bicarbonate transport system substrate-binding protein
MADYELVSVGNINARWDAVRSGDCAAGLLGKAHAALAEQAGFVRLRGDPDPWDNYQGGVFTVRRDWATAHRDEVIGFIRAMLKGLDWVLSRENTAALPAMLIRHLPHLNLTREAAQRAAAELQSARSILKPGLPINIAGTRVVLALREKYGTSGAALGTPESYLDLGYYDAAVRG